MLGTVGSQKLNDAVPSDISCTVGPDPSLGPTVQAPHIGTALPLTPSAAAIRSAVAAETVWLASNAHAWPLPRSVDRPPSLKTVR